MVNGPGYPLASVDRALRLLALFRERDSLRVQDAADFLGVAPSTAHRLLAMLAHHQYAVCDRRHVYHPGPLLNAGAGYTDHRAELLKAARPHLAALARHTHETVHLMMLEGTGARFVDGADSDRALRVATRVGIVLPAHLTSGGKALLAELSMAELERRYPRGLRLTPEAGGPALAVLARELARIRRQGFAINVEETEHGVNAIGTCVRGRSGRAVAAVVVAAPSVRVRRRELQSLREPLNDAAAAISRELGSGSR